MSQTRMLFPNLHVRDVQKTRAFFAELGFEYNEKFSGETAACMVINDQACVMLLQREYFKTFTTKKLCDSHELIACTIAVSFGSREDVDRVADRALAAGATVAKEPQDLGFMYGRSFFDLDGYQWEMFWMDAQASQ